MIPQCNINSDQKDVSLLGGPISGSVIHTRIPFSLEKTKKLRNNARLYKCQKLGYGYFIAVSLCCTNSVPLTSDNLF